MNISLDVIIELAKDYIADNKERKFFIDGLNEFVKEAKEQKEKEKADKVKQEWEFFTLKENPESDDFGFVLKVDVNYLQSVELETIFSDFKENVRCSNEKKKKKRRILASLGDYVAAHKNSDWGSHAGYAKWVSKCPVYDFKEKI